jgi:hypothetical protein
LRQVYEHEPPFNQGANWFFPAGRDFTEGQSHNFTNGEVYPYTDRSVTYHMAFIGLKRLGVGQFYLVDLSDRDGNLDVYFGPRAVKGLEANFIETGASQTFELMFRFYGVAPVKNLGQGLASHQPRARLLAMAMTVPSISRYMKSSLILIGMVPHHPW